MGFLEVYKYLMYCVTVFPFFLKQVMNAECLIYYIKIHIEKSQ